MLRPISIRKRLIITLVTTLSLFLLASGVYAQDYNTAVLPGTLERISWGGIIAGTIIAIVIQLGLNLLAIGVGVSQINPNPDYGDEPGSVKSAGISTGVIAAVSVLISLFIGGYIAARFAGSPDRTDALLNGLMVWGLDTIITLFLLTTTLGRIFSGLSALLGQGLSLVGSVTGAVATGAANLASGAASAVGSAAGAVGGAVSGAAQNVAGAAQEAIDQNPDVQNALRNQDTFVQNIQQEAMKLLNQAGVEPQAAQGEAQGAIEDVKNTVQDAAARVQQNPTEAGQIITESLNRIFQRGQQAAGTAVQQVSPDDRNKLIDTLAERTNISREEAEAQLRKWEGDYQKVRQQSEQAVQQARQRAEQLQAEIGQRAEQVRRDAEQKAREAAEATTKAISSVALAGFVAILLGAIAAGLGGTIGAPQNIPVAQVDINRDTNVNTPATLVITTNPTSIPFTAVPTTTP